MLLLLLRLLLLLSLLAPFVVVCLQMLKVNFQTQFTIYNRILLNR